MQMEAYTSLCAKCEDGPSLVSHALICKFIYNCWTVICDCVIVHNVQCTQIPDEHIYSVKPLLIWENRCLLLYIPTNTEMLTHFSAPFTLSPLFFLSLSSPPPLCPPSLTLARAL